MGRARPATGRALDVRAAPAAILSAVRTSRVVSTHAWLAAGLAPVQPDSHVCVQGIYYVPDAPRWHDNGWAGQFVLAYMRLVRAGTVRAQRKRSAQWREVQAARHRRETRDLRSGARRTCGTLGAAEAAAAGFTTRRAARTCGRAAARTAARTATATRQHEVAAATWLTQRRSGGSSPRRRRDRRSLCQRRMHFSRTTRMYKYMRNQ